MQTKRVYLADDIELPGYVNGVWCERMHLAFTDLAIGVGDDGGPAPLICLKRKGGVSRIAIPTFAFDEDGNVIPPQLKFFTAPLEERWIGPQLISAIEASRNNCNEVPLFGYVVSSEAWPNQVGICIAEHECEPDAHDFTDGALVPDEAQFGHRPVERAVFYDHVIAR